MFYYYIVIIADSGVESSTTYAGHEGAISDGELPHSFEEDTISQDVTPQPR